MSAWIIMYASPNMQWELRRLGFVADPAYQTSCERLRYWKHNGKHALVSIDLDLATCALYINGAFYRGYTTKYSLLRRVRNLLAQKDAS